MESKVMDRLNELIQLDTDAVLAYQQAIEACEVSEIASKLRSFQDDHQRHIGDLSELVRKAGGEPKIKRDLKGFLIEGFTAIASRGDHTALLAMRGNEELTTRTYQAALEPKLPPDVKDVVERNFEDELRHLAWIKHALDTRLWETKEGAAAVEEEGKGKKRHAA